MSNSLEIKVNDKIYQHFSRIYIRISLDEICHYLEMTVSERGRQEIAKNDKIEVRYVIDGFARRVTIVEVDTISRLLNASSKSYRITARSAARNILDSSWSGQLRNLSLYQVIANIASKFGVPTANFAGQTDKIESFEWEAESPWEKMQTAALAQGCILYSSQVGGLYLNRVSGRPRPEGFQLLQNRNIEEISLEENANEQFYTYEVVGEGGKATATDSTCQAKSRILTLNMSDSTMSYKELQRWAQVQMRRRRSNKIKVRMTGWGLDKKELAVVKEKAAAAYRNNNNISEAQKRALYGFETLWQVNMYVPIRSDVYGIGVERPAYLLVSEVEYTVEAEAISCNISLKPREDYLGS